MKFSLFFFCLVLCPFLSQLAAGQAAIDSKGRIDVYLIGGQSNATGQGYIRNLPEDFKMDQEVILFASGKPHLNSGAPELTWQPLRQASESPDRFGPELSFGNRIKQLNPGVKIGLIKHAQSGTNLFSQWNPGSSASDMAHWGGQFKTFVDTVDLGLHKLREQGYEPTISGMIWQQGESDNDTTHSKEYAVNLHHFIGRVREQFNVPDLRFVYGYVYPPPCTNENRLLIRRAEFDVDQNSGSLFSTKNAFVVNTDDLNQRANDPGTSLPADHVHFGTLGMLNLGARMAERMAGDNTNAKTPVYAEFGTAADDTRYSMAASPPATTIPSDSNYKAHPDWNRQCEQRVAAIKGKPCDLIFIGDSITQNFIASPTKAWPLVGGPVWQKYYANPKILNFGVGADKTQNVLWRLDHMDVQALRPRVAVILIGINNNDDKAEDITAGISAVIEKTRAVFPGVKVIAISVLPSNRGIARYEQVNKAIAKRADNDLIYYLDVYSKMAPLGNDTFKGVGFDHVHLTNDGYEIWASEMNPLLDKLLQAA